VITLGSPHQGTEIAQVAQELAPERCPTACQQLAPDSDLLRAIPQGAVPGPTWVSLWTSHDDVVTPPGSGWLQGAVDVRLQSVCPDDQVRHSGLPDDPLVAGLVARAIGTAPLTAAPGPAECAALRRAGAG
jgi:hypothetical protein